MSDRIELSSSFTRLFNKSRQATAYIGMEHTLKNAHRTPLESKNPVSAKYSFREKREKLFEF